MEKKTDLRVIKTYQALTDAFFQLLSKKRFEDITVNELCEQAYIRRATFYKHFADKYDFFTFVVRRVFEQYAPEHDCSDRQVKPVSFYISIMEDVLHFLIERESMVHFFSESSMYNTLMNIFTEEISQEIRQYLEEDKKNGAVFPASAEITAQFFTGAMINAIKYWFTSDRTITAEELTRQLTALLCSFGFIGSETTPDSPAAALSPAQR